jgi:hypothetical protein
MFTAVSGSCCSFFVFSFLAFLFGCLDFLGFSSLGFRFSFLTGTWADEEKATGTLATLAGLEAVRVLVESGVAVKAELGLLDAEEVLLDTSVAVKAELGLLEDEDGSGAVKMKRKLSELYHMKRKLLKHFTNL